MSTYECNACEWGVCLVIVRGGLPTTCLYDAEIASGWNEVPEL